MTRPFPARLCRRGEATCETVVDVSGGKTILCGDPAAVAYRAGRGARWLYACREHYGPEETDELREAAKGGES